MLRFQSTKAPKTESGLPVVTDSRQPGLVFISLCTLTQSIEKQLRERGVACQQAFLFGGGTRAR